MMIILNTYALTLPFIEFSCYVSTRLPPFSTFTFSIQNRSRLRTPVFVSKVQKLQGEVDIYVEDEEDDTTPRKGFRGRKDMKDYDKDPEFAEILGSCLDNPQKARSKMEDRLKKKRNKILHTKTGSGTPMKVTFNKFDFSNSYIWFEFYNAPLEKDISLICDAIRAWHIIGRLGGCNSMNMQLSQSPMDKRPSYDAISGANVTPTTFYNIGDLEIQDNLARIWVDIGTTEALLLDILINALTQISSEQFLEDNNYRLPCALCQLTYSNSNHLVGYLCKRNTVLLELSNWCLVDLNLRIGRRTLRQKM